MKRSIEKRATKETTASVIENQDGKKIVEGVIPYNKKSQRMSLGYSDCEFEMLLPSVFNKTIADKADVYCNYAHDDLAILGNTKSGTLQLENQDDGLHFTLELDPDNEIAMRAYSTIKRGDCNTLSFEFYPFDWIEEQGVCKLRSAKLTAISLCVINPAYLDTDTQTITERNLEEMDKIKRAIETKELDLENPETLEKVKELLEQIQTAINPEPQKDSVDEPKEDKPQDEQTEKQAEPEKAEVETPTPQSQDTDKAEDTEPEKDEDAEKKAELERIQKELEQELN